MFYVGVLASGQNAGLEAAIRPAGVLAGRAERAGTHVGPRTPIAILGVAFDNVTLAHAVEVVVDMVESRQPHYVVTANADFLAQARQDVELRRILLDAHLVVCDGTPLVWASRLLGNPLHERVAGADLVPQLIEVAAQRGYRMFFLGGAPEVTAKAVANLRNKHPRAIVAGHYSPPFRPLLGMNHNEILRRIRSAKPDILFVSFGCPKAEAWMAMHYRSLGVPVIMGVGGTIDFLAGRIPRAPHWMQVAGVEWMFRLAQEPARLFPRYANDVRHCLMPVFDQWRNFRPKSAEADTVEREVFHELKPGSQHVRFSKRLDVQTVEQNQGLWKQVLEGSGPSFLNLSAVEVLDSTGIGLMLRLRRHLLDQKRCLVVVAPSAAVRRALETMRLADIFVLALDDGDAWRVVEQLERESKQPVCPAAIGGARVDWCGEVTAANAGDVWTATRTFFHKLETRCGEFVVDLSSVKYVDTAGVGVMLRVKKLVERHGFSIRFVGLHANVVNTLHLKKVEAFLIGDGI